MKKTIALLSFLSCIFVSHCLYAESESALDANDIFLKKTMSAFMNDHQLPGIAVAIIVNGKAYSYYAGYADIEKKIPISNKTIFEVGSISKIMTSILFTQEVDFAKMDFNDSVRKYLPELPPTFDKITLQELATYTSGLPFTIPDSIKSHDELNTYLSKWTPTYKPGRQWMYSNFGIGILGYALEGSTLRNYDDLYWRHIASPLGMEKIGTFLSDKQKLNFAQGYDKNNQPVAHAEVDLFPASHGIKMSADDMQHFLSAAVGLPGTPERVFYPIRMTQAAYVRLSDGQQGLAWQIHDMKSNDVNSLLHEPADVNMGPMRVAEIYERAIYNGDALVDKTGSTNGFRAYIAVIPNKKSGIAILTNKYVPNSVIVNKGRELLFKMTNIIPGHS